jgi:acetyltransferase-like isoleucine patch superfamily enzyme
MDTQKELLLIKEPKIKKYQRLVIGTTGFWTLMKYELIVLLTSWVPGALGLAMRAFFYPRILKHCGNNVTFGVNVVLRHPNKISIGDNVVIDDNCVIDAKGENNNGISLDNNVFIGRNTIVYCQNGDIFLGEASNIGSNCQIFSANFVRIGENVLMGAYSYLIGGGHNYENIDIPIIDQGRSAKGIHLEKNIWIGAGVKILDGTNIGKNAIIGTGAVVRDDIPEYAIAGGVPAKIISDRRTNKAIEL